MNNFFTKKRKSLWALSFFTTAIFVLIFSGVWGTVYSYTVNKIEIIKTDLLQSAADFNSVLVNKNQSSVLNGVTTERDEIVQISAGWLHNCILYKMGKVRCSGNNWTGMLGDGTTTQRTSPVEVPGLSNVIQISAGRSHSCALIEGGTAKCWGHNGAGGLGDNTTNTSLVPVDVVGVNNIKQIIASHGSNGADFPTPQNWESFTCALINDGTVKCWGTNNHRQLGDGTTAEVFPPTNVVDLDNVVSIDSGDMHSCALINDGTVKCWGQNAYGQLADAVPLGEYALKAETIPGLSGVQKISVGVFFSCALIDDGSVKCWGINDRGQIGNGTFALRQVTPAAVLGITDAVDIATGYAFSCAELANGTVKCWGQDYQGSLGNGGDINDPNTNTPAEVIGINSPDKMDAGGGHVCILKENIPYCWGSNEYGQLGDGTINHNFVSEPVENLSAYKYQISSTEFRISANIDDSRELFAGWDELFISKNIPVGTSVQYTLGVYNSAKNSCSYTSPVTDLVFDFNVSPTDISSIPSDYKDLCLKLEFSSPSVYLSPKVSSISALYKAYYEERLMGSGKNYFSGSSGLKPSAGMVDESEKVLKSGHRSFIVKYSADIQKVFDSYNHGLIGGIETYINRNGFEVFKNYKIGRVGKDRFKRKQAPLIYRGPNGKKDLSARMNEIRSEYQNEEVLRGSAPVQKFDRKMIYRGDDRAYTTAETQINSLEKRKNISLERKKWERKITRKVSESKIKKGPRNIKMIINGRSVPVNFMVD